MEVGDLFWFQTKVLSQTQITLNPDGANGTSKFIEIGGLVHFFLVSVSSSSISADNWVSFMPAIRLILSKISIIETSLAGKASIVIPYFQTMAFSDALYLAFPFKQINCTPDVLSGVGIFTSIFWPSSDGLKFDFSTTCVQ